MDLSHFEMFGRVYLQVCEDLSHAAQSLHRIEVYSTCGLECQTQTQAETRKELREGRCFTSE